MVFETKKIQIETLGEYLREVRSSLGYSLEDVSEKANIKKKFLESLENGKMHELPADVYVLGFLKKIAELYSLEGSVLVSQFKKEKHITLQQYKSVENKVQSKAKRWFSGIVITPKSVSFGGGIFFIFATVLYIIYQIISINKTPLLVVSEPADRQVISSSVVVVKGMTDPGVKLFINDQSVFVNSSGNFEAQIGLSNGPKDLKFIARNKFDKSSEKTITIIGSIDGATTTQAIEKPIELQLSFSGAVTISYSSDSGMAQTKDFLSGQSLVIQAKDKILMSTTDAGSTKAIFNGENFGLLGKSGERLENVPFLRESDSMKRATTTGSN